MGIQAEQLWRSDTSCVLFLSTLIPNTHNLYTLQAEPVRLRTGAGILSGLR